MRTRRSGESAVLLLDAIDILTREKIDYAVIGALAASIHGAVRASMDADIVVSMAIQQTPAVEKLFQAAGFKTELTRGDFEDPIPGLLRLEDPYRNRVDLLIGLRGLEQAAYSRAISVPFQGETLRFIGREDFIAMKVFAGGPIDIQDATRAIEAAGGAIDLDLLRRLAKGYGRETARALERLLQKVAPTSQP